MLHTFYRLKRFTDCVPAWLNNFMFTKINICSV